MTLKEAVSELSECDVSQLVLVMLLEDGQIKGHKVDGVWEVDRASLKAYKDRHMARRRPVAGLTHAEPPSLGGP